MKLVRKRKVWYLFLLVFWQLLPNFLKEDWTLDCVSPQIADFSNISKFHKILSLKLFSNLWGNYYTKIFILDFMFRFNPLNANPTKWSNTLKQFVCKLPTDCLSVFDHFVKLALKGLIVKNWTLFLFRSSHRSCSIKKLFFKILQYSKEKTCVEITFNKVVRPLYLQNY